MRAMALVVGVVYLALGVAGFVAADGLLIARNTTNVVGVFSVGFLLNLGHLAVGVLGVVAARSVTGARLYGWGMTVVCAALLAYGIPAAATSGEGDLSNINWADDWLYGVTGLVGLTMALVPGRAGVPGIEETMAYIVTWRSVERDRRKHG